MLKRRSACNSEAVAPPGTAVPQLGGRPCQARGRFYCSETHGVLVQGVVDVWAVEVAADDVWLTLASAEETAGLCGEFGLVRGSVLLVQAVFDVGVDNLSGLSSGEYGSREVQPDVVGVGMSQSRTFFERCAECPSATSWTLWSSWPASRPRKRHITSAVKLSVKTMKRIRPLVLIADIAFTENRSTLRRTTVSFPSRPRCGR